MALTLAVPVPPPGQGAVPACRQLHRTSLTPLACAPPFSLQAEVQSLHADGSIALHARSLKYGKVGWPMP